MDQGQGKLVYKQSIRANIFHQTSEAIRATPVTSNAALRCVRCACIPNFHLADHLNAAEKIVKVPEMAESISEGTLKQWTKRMPTHVYEIFDY